MSPKKKKYDIGQLRGELVDFNSLKLQVAMELDVLGRTAEETIDKIEQLLNLAMHLEEAKGIVAQFQGLMNTDKKQLVEWLWKYEVYPKAAKWEIEQIIVESNEHLSLYDEDDQAIVHLLSLLFFKMRGEEHISNNKIYLSYMRYYADNVLSKINEDILRNNTNRLVGHAFLLGTILSSMNSAQLYQDEIFQDALGRTKSGVHVSKGRHEPEKYKYDQYVEQAVKAWGIGCELLHPQMARLINEGLDQSVLCKRLKDALLAASIPEERILGNPGVKKIREECPCPKMLDCSIGRKLPRGKKFRLLANCPPKKS